MRGARRNACCVLLTLLLAGSSALVQAGSICSGLSCLFRGQLIEQKTSLRLSASDFTKLLNSSATGQQLLQIAGTPRCNLEIKTFRYLTIGGAGEPTISSAALMIPGGGASCTGPRPLMLYAHGTTTYRNYNIADITQTDPANADGAGEGIGVAAIYAAQGYIVVATNYAGYAGSPLPYHPYLNGDQQSADVIDSWRAARFVMDLPDPGNKTRENGKLFVTGYSQGGYVALATHRALQAAGIAVTASAPGSGPYALGAMADALVQGEVDLGSTIFTVLVTTSYQHAYGNIYHQPGDFFEPAYAPGIESLLPSVVPMDTLFAEGKLPATQLFSSVPPAPQFAALTPPIAPPLAPPQLTPLFALGFGTANLVRNTYRLAMLEDQLVHPDGAYPSPTAAMAPAASPMQPLRQAFRRNDLRNWVPRAPVLLCGGHLDPTVFFFNAAIEQAYWQNAHVAPGLTNILDVDSAPGVNDPFAAVKTGFAQAEAAVAAQAVQAGATDNGFSAVLQAYHGDIVAPFCMVAARGFFSNF
ncbi:S9 family peptidase [Paraburkholderia sp. DHOC27]|uniref:alpha/beta hydrolase family protein n=1 Tax=Paraburkholderia sp. DHOC27 TaxID=2303330 RepID=UPI000E3E90B9|nr:alpha/beta hydrolase [Paraburkholderia sp. DHOC27]RFU49239.1 alpha/beta hydrolase [Paraburkholderia sp. DHOC27]